MIARAELSSLLKQLQSGKTTIAELLKRLSEFQTENLGFAQLDHGRESRLGLPEVIYAEGKTAKQISAIAKRLIASGSRLLITRLSPDKYAALKRSLPRLRYFADARAATVPRHETLIPSGLVIVTAGTSDVPIAEEAVVTCNALGYEVEKIYDAGVAGIHRLLAHSRQLKQAKVVIVVAGMEGALPSVVGGLVGVPVIAVPSSVGYGTSFGGITSLLAMLNSCASGVTVVNIDNGFGAAIAAIRIIQGNDRGKNKRTSRPVPKAKRKSR